MSYEYCVTVYNRLTRAEDTLTVSSVHFNTSVAAEAFEETNHGVLKVLSIQPVHQQGSEKPHKPVVAVHRGEAQGRIWHNRDRLLAWLSKDYDHEAIAFLESLIDLKGAVLFGGVTYIDLEFYISLGEQP